MLDLVPALDRLFATVCSPVSRALSRACGGPDVPICAQVGPRWAWIIGRRHCAQSRETWNAVD